MLLRGSWQERLMLSDAGLRSGSVWTAELGIAVQRPPLRRQRRPSPSSACWRRHSASEHKWVIACRAPRRLVAESLIQGLEAPWLFGCCDILPCPRRESMGKLTEAFKKLEGGKNKFVADVKSGNSRPRTTMRRSMPTRKNWGNSQKSTIRLSTKSEIARQEARKRPNWRVYAGRNWSTSGPTHAWPGTPRNKPSPTAMRLKN